MVKGNIFLDKRSHYRMLVKLPITFEVLSEQEKGKSLLEGDKVQWTAESWDASLGGMYIISNELLKPSDRLTLKMTLPHVENPLGILAEVVWADRSGAGLRFVSMSDADVQTLEQFLKGITVSD